MYDEGYPLTMDRIAWFCRALWICDSERKNWFNSLDERGHIFCCLLGTTKRTWAKRIARRWKWRWWYQKQWGLKDTMEDEDEDSRALGTFIKLVRPQQFRGFRGYDSLRLNITSFFWLTTYLEGADVWQRPDDRSSLRMAWTAPLCKSEGCAEARRHAYTPP